MLGLTGVAGAKSHRTTPYPYDQVWPTAVRFLRIDEGHEILEKDADAGYVIFQITDDGKQFRGTLELIRVVESDEPAVRMVVDLEDRPSYMEQGILDRLLVKLRTEHGAPPRSPPPDKSPPAPPAESAPDDD